MVVWGELSDTTLVCIRNRTPWRMLVERAGPPAVVPVDLAPFERRRQRGRDLARLQPELDYLELRGLIDVSRVPQYRRSKVAIGVCFIVSVGFLLSLAVVHAHWIVSLAVALAVGVAALAAIPVFQHWPRAGKDPDVVPGSALSQRFTVAVKAAVHGRVGRSRRNLQSIVERGLQAVGEGVLACLPAAWSWMWQWGCILLALGLALIVPAAVIYFGTDLHDQLIVSPFRYWHIIGSGSPSRLTGRFIELGSIIVLSALPALMFLQFDRTHITALADRWKRQTFRLDPTLVTESDYTAKYGRLISEVHTSSERRLFARLAPTRRSPILVATVVIAAGWIFTLVNQTFPKDSNPLLSFVQVIGPYPSAVCFGFLGAYFFSLQLVLRGYIRGDLQPKTYSMVSVRIVTVVILAWVLQGALTVDNRTLLVIAFAAGIFPDIALRKLLELARFQQARDTGPLSDLDGLDLYDRTRLAEEGITSVQALANHGLVDLMLRTRIPMSRLIDWVDQATLYQHVVVPREDPSTRFDHLRHLRRHGVRTATDLVQVVDAAQALRPSGRDAMLEQLALPRLVREGHDGIRQMRAILAAIADSEWITMLWNWRHSEFANADCARMRWIGADGLLHKRVGRSERTWEPWHAPLLTALPSFSGVGSNHQPGDEHQEPMPAAEPPGELVGHGGRGA